MGKQKRLSEGDKKLILDLNKRGVVQRKIANEVGVTPAAISQFLKRNEQPKNSLDRVKKYRDQQFKIQQKINELSKSAKELEQVIKEELSQYVMTHPISFLERLEKTE